MVIQPQGQVFRQRPRSEKWLWPEFVPARCINQRLQAAWVTDELVQHADNFVKLGPAVAVFLPAVEH